MPRGSPYPQDRIKTQPTPYPPPAQSKMADNETMHMFVHVVCIYLIYSLKGDASIESIFQKLITTVTNMLPGSGKSSDDSASAKGG